MSKCVVYQSGGFTNYGISYRIYSQEELEEIKKEDVKRRSVGRIKKMEGAEKKLVSDILA